jgi:hypothetical protein
LNKKGGREREKKERDDEREIFDSTTDKRASGRMFRRAFAPGFTYYIFDYGA